MTSSTPTTPDRNGWFADRFSPIALLLVAGLLLRLLIAYVIAPGQGLSVDLDLFDKWAQTLAQHGPGTFYRDAESAVYSPGYMYFLWPIGLIGSLIAGIQGISAYDATFGLLKIPPILADVVIGLLLYRAAGRWFGARAGLIAAALYLFVPATWYESALWGQVDAVGMAFVLAALLALVGGWSEATVALVVFAVIIKPWYALAIVIIAPVLLRRHLLARGSGPVPAVSGRLADLDRALGGWFTQRQGIERLASCAAVGFITGVLALLPFDMWRYAPDSLAGIPIVGHIAGFVQQTIQAAGQFPVLSANAFNAWALVGPIPLYSELSRTFIWAYDSLQVLGPVTAGTVGTALLGAVVGLVALVLLIRDDRTAILTSFTVLAFAFFALPTRVHERYEFPIFVIFALLVAGRSISERRWRWWYLAVGVLQAINLHAVVTLNRPTFATPGLIGAPLGDLFRSDAVVIVASLANTLLFGILLVAWLRALAWPTLWPVVQRTLLRRPPAALPAEPYPPIAAAVPQGPAEAAAARPTPAESVAGSSLLRSAAGFANRVAGPFRQRLNATAPPTDSTAALATEGGGRLDRRDAILMAIILVVTLAVRTFRIDTPRGMYFDELYYASTATEFLQDWRYGIPTEIFEYTHPHISKYVQALSLWAFGDDRATEGGSVGAAVRDVAFEPAYYDPNAGGKYRGDWMAIATGTGILLAPHGSFADEVLAPLPGAGLVAFDVAAHRLYAATDAGTLWAIDTASLEAAGGKAPTAVQVGQVAGPIDRLVVVAQGRLLAGSADGQLTLVDGTTGRQLATATLPGLGDLVPITAAGQARVVAAFPGGLVQFDGTTLKEVSRVGLAAPPRGMDLVDGSDFGWRNQDMLPIPTLYVALDSNQLEAVQIAPDGTLAPFDVFAMPGSVSQVRWDRPTNMVHVLGTTSDGHPTLYVVEPHTDSVFADAPLPYVPAAWLIDAQPNTPALDRQRALVFTDSGVYLSIDTGSHARAWRLPGLIAGTLTAVLMYLLARLLFRRRSVAVLLAIVMALDSMLFIQGRIAMNDSLLAFFIVAALTLLMALFRAPKHGVGRWLLPMLGLPLVGLLLGLAVSTKWVGAYAIGGAVLLVLARTRPGRWVALGVLVLLTGLLGFQAIADQPPNLPFPILMLGLTALAALVVARKQDPGSAAPGSDDPDWVNPRLLFGLPFAYAMVCLLVIPALVYVVSYIPWTLSVAGGPQLFSGWPPGHTGQTFLDLQSQMYHYHNDLRTPHAAGSPWWAWPFALKPVWGYFDTFSDGSQAMMLITANPVLVWLGVPAMAFGAWQAWRRRSMALGFVVIAMCSLWLPWSRIDRVAFNYHWYTILPFFYLLLAYFLAELWDGPSRRTWSLARVSFAVLLVLPAAMWLLKDPLCGLAGVGLVNPGSFECSRSIADLLPLILVWLVAALVAGWFILGMARPRAFVVVVLGTAAIGFVALYPAVSAIQIPAGWPLIFQGLLPTWEISFQFNFNTSPFVSVPLIGLGPLVLTAVAAALAWFVMRRSSRGRLSLPPASPPGAVGGDTLPARKQASSPKGEAKQAIRTGPTASKDAAAALPAKRAYARAPRSPEAGSRPTRAVMRPQLGGLERRDAWMLLGVLAFAVLLPTLVGAVAGSLDIARNDDGIYRRLAIHLFSTGSFDLNGASQTALIGQLVAAQPFLWLSGGHSWGLWVVGVLFDTTAIIAGYLMLRRLLPMGRATFAILLLPLFPGFLPYAPSFMTDVPGLAAEFGCLAFGLVALARRPISMKWLIASLAVGLFGFTIREFALAAPAAVLLLALIAQPRRTSIWLSSLAFIAVGFAFHQWRAGLPGQLTIGLLPITAESVDRVMRAASSVAFALLPAAVVSWPRLWRRARPVDVAVGLGLGLLLVGGRIADLFSTGQVPSVLLDNLMSKWGTTEQVMLAGGRPLLIPDPVWDALNLLALLATLMVLATATGMIGALIRRDGTHGLWRAARGGSPAWLLLLFAGAMAVGLAGFGLVAAIYDRYLWALIPPFAALLLAFGDGEETEFVRAAPQRAKRATAVTAAFLAAVLGMVGVVFLLNSDAFDGARWRAGEAVAEAGVPAEKVDAGIEWLGFHAPGIAQWTAPIPEIWYEALWPEFEMCGLVASVPWDRPGFELLSIDPQAYRLLLFAGPEQPLYRYRVAGPPCT